MVFWQSIGWVVLLALAGCAMVLTFGLRKGLRVRWNPNTLFLLGWLLIELAGCFILTPFPAARRVIGLVVIGGLLAARAVSRFGRLHSERRPGGWVIAFGIATGVAVAAIDWLDAFPEKAAAERAATLTAERPPASTVWFAGHWGFQYYCERAGMRPLVPGRSVLAPGDYLVLPIYPDSHGLHRPHIGNVPIRPPAGVAEEVSQIVLDDPLSRKRCRTLWRGRPVVGRDHPRLRVAVYRMRSAWLVPTDR